MQRRIVIYFVLSCVFATASISYATPPPSKIDGLRQSVLALDSAWTRAISDLQEKKQAGDLNKTEQEDYARFITFLSGRIDYYCHQLRDEGGDQAVVDLPCTAVMETASDQKQPTALTKTEQVAGLDKSLTDALGAFDEELLKEEERLAARMPNERESGRGNGGRGGSPGGSGQYGSGQGNGGQTGTTGGTQGQDTSGSYSGNSQNGQGSAPSSGAGAGAGTGSQEQQDDPRTGPQEIASGYDDIVARQLREAAEKETDPELKKKLWEEYRKYKEGIQ